MIQGEAANAQVSKYLIWPIHYIHFLFLHAHFLTTMWIVKSKDTLISRKEREKEG
jgi:hypothetical protein